MNWPSLQTLAQFSVERVLNALPEGLLIAFLAWALLRLLRKQSSGTRFAVSFLALLAVSALPLLRALGEPVAELGATTSLGPGISWLHLQPALTIPGSWAIFVFMIWVLGSSAAMARLASGLWSLGKLRRGCTAVVAADLDPLVRKTVDSIRGVAIATSESVRVPAAIGFRKRTIVLPAWALRELPPEDLKVILLHEFAHLRRGDDWTNLFQKIVRAIFFFHPAVWWIEKRLTVEREMACDDAVVAQTANPSGYANCLVSLLEKSLAHRPLNPEWSMAQAAVDRAREASLRLARILDRNRPHATRLGKPALAMVAAFFIACLALLSHAPQFVAFDHGVQDHGVQDHGVQDRGVQAFDHADSAAVSQYPLPPEVQSSSKQPAVVPATLRTGSSSSMRTTISTTTTAMLLPARTVARNQPVSNPQAIPASVTANLQIGPSLQTLVFVEATEFMTPGSSVWRVQVWQVTFVSAMHERLARVPVANSI